MFRGGAVGGFKDGGGFADVGAGGHAQTAHHRRGGIGDVVAIEVEGGQDRILLRPGLDLLEDAVGDAVIHQHHCFPLAAPMAAADGGETEFLLDNRHLYLRTSRMTNMLKIRSSVFGAIHSYFRTKDFVEYQAPNFVAGAVEGGSTLFEVPYFGKKAYLTQSWQLYAEAAMPALERLYTIAPSFRAEKSRTRRHLTEFWHAEMEVAWASNAEIMSHGEGLVRHIARTVLDEREDELSEIERDLDLIARYADNPYPRMRYDEAVETLQGLGVEIEWGQDLDYSKEKILTQDFDVPHFLTHYPKIAKPFYHRVDPDDEKYVLCHDLLAPEGYGEIIGGGERTWSEEEILARIDEEGTPREPYQFYIDTRTYGGVPHGGFGMGVERICMLKYEIDDIRLFYQGDMRFLEQF